MTVDGAAAFPRRDAALARMTAAGVAVRHAPHHVVAQHGHGFLCCCLMQQCRDRTCNLNAAILDDLEAERGR